MNNTKSIQKIIYHRTFSNAKYVSSMQPEYFDDPPLQVIFRLAKEFYQKYISKPTSSQVQSMASSKSIEVSSIDLDDLYAVNMSEYEEEWLDELVESHVRLCSFRQGVVNAVSYIKSTDVDTDNATEIIEKAYSIIGNGFNVEFNQTAGMYFTDVEKHRNDDLERLESGYPFVESASGGGMYRKGLAMFMAASGGGKSLWMSNLAANMMLNGLNVAYITCELPESMIAANIGSNILNVPISEYDQFASTPHGIATKIRELQMTSLKPHGKLYIREFPSGSASVIEIEADLKKQEVEHRFRFDVVFVDYIGIMRDYRSSKADNSYTKIRNISIDLRAMAQKNIWLVATASQINREGIAASDINAGNVRESIALIDNCDQVFAITQDPYMRANNEYVLKCIKTRRGPGANWRKKFNVDYQHMRITENMMVDIEKTALF